MQSTTVNAQTRAVPVVDDARPRSQSRSPGGFRRRAVTFGPSA